MAPVYIRGFVRTYAKYLKLDSATMSAALDAELSQNKKFCEPPPLTNRPRTLLDFLMLQFSKLNRRWVLGILGVAVVAVIVAVIVRSFTGPSKADPLKKLGPGLYESSSGQSGETIPLPTTPAKR